MNDRVVEVCELVSCDLSLVSEAQLAEHWMILSETGRRHFAAWLDNLVRDDLLHRLRVIAKIIPLPDAPLLVARPDDPVAEIVARSGQLSWQFEKRWHVEPEVTTVYVRGPKCRRVFGGAARPDISNLAAVSHDLALSALYFRFVRSCPRRALDWVPDWERKAVGLEYGEKLVDVVLYDATGTPYLAVEIGGTYLPARLIALQLFCAENLKLPLEIW